MNSGGAINKTERIDAALRAIADAIPAEIVTVEVTFHPEAASARRFSLRVNGSSGEITETERHGGHERTAILGASTVGERKALARALLGAQIASSADREPASPAGSASSASYAVRVVVADVSATVTTSAESPSSRDLERAIQVVYAAASRFGARPLTLLALPPEPPAAPGRAAPAAVSQQLLDFANKKIGFDALARWLAEHKTLWLPADTSSGQARPRFVADGPTRKVDLFTTETAFDVWWAKEGGGRQPTVMNEIWGAPTLARMPDMIDRVDIDPASPIALQIQGQPLATLRAVCVAVEVERSFVKMDDPASLRLVLDHSYRVAYRESGAPAAPGGSTDAKLMSVPGSRGEPLAAAFTSEDSAAAFVASSGGPSAGIGLASMKGRDLMMSLGFLRCEGVFVNPRGPGTSVVLSREVCMHLAGVPG